MSVLFLLTSLLGCLAFVPMSFTIFQFFIASENAFLLSLGLCIVTIAACLLCHLEIKSFLYRIISAVSSIIFAYVIWECGFFYDYSSSNLHFYFYQSKERNDSL